MTYQYSPLTGESHIRLLELTPGDWDQPIRFEAFVVSLDEEPQYSALSYCWGSAEKPLCIYSDGGPLPVSENLWRLLWRCRLGAKEPLMLWADAVCINQDDNDEKGMQIPLMKRIYKQAKQVYIWLGNDEKESQGIQAMNLLHDLIDAFFAQSREDDRRSYYELAYSGELSRFKVPSVQDERWEHLLNFLSRDWFTRMWVIQEVTVPDEDSITVLMGSGVISWKIFSASLNYTLKDLDIGALVTRDMPSERDSVWTPVMRLIDTRWMPEEDRTLLSLLMYHRTSKASDPRDKIYALLGLASDLDSFPGIKSNYNIRTEILYKHVAEEILKGSKDLDILSSTQVGMSRGVSTLPTLPTWTPDWRVNSQVGPICKSDYGVQLRMKFSACGASISQARFCGDQLLLSGIKFDRVAATSPALTISHPEDFKSWFPMINRILNMAFSDTVLIHWERTTRARSGIKYPTGEPILDVFLLTLVCGYLPKGYTLELLRTTDFRMRIRRPVFRLFRFLYQFGLASLHFPLFLIWSFVETLMPFFFWYQYKEKPQLEMGMAEGRSAVRTLRGYVGLASGPVSVSDSIVIFEGGKVPLILRLRGDDTWELVGDCYVHGIMQGEMWDSNKLEGFVLV